MIELIRKLDNEYHRWRKHAYKFQRDLGFLDVLCVRNIYILYVRTYT